MKHYIQRKEFMIDIGPRPDAFHIQHEAAHYARNILLPALEKIFDELSGEDEVIYIDRLYIDVGPLDEAGLRTGLLTPAMYQRIKEEFSRVILGQRPDVPATRTSLRANVLAQWWYYMEYGRLAWNGDRPDPQWYSKVLEMFSVDYSAITALRTALQQKPLFRARVSAQHVPQFLETLITVMTSSRQEQLGIAVEEFCRALLFIDQLAKRHLPGTTTPDALVVRDQRPAIRDWINRLADFLALPATERMEYTWNSLLKDAATRPAEWSSRSGVEILIDWISDRPALLRLLEDSFAGRDNLFIRRFNARIAASPVDDPTDQALEAAIEDIFRILQFLESKYKELSRDRTASDGLPSGKPVSNALRQWAARFADLLALPHEGRRQYIQRWTRTIAAGSSQRTGSERAAILLDWICNSPRLFGLIASQQPTDLSGPMLQLITQRHQRMIREPDASRPVDSPTRTNNRRSDDPASPDDPPAGAALLKPEEFLFRSEEVTDESIHIPHAGIVLVHPFLSTFFSRLQLWDKAGFVDLYARQTAVYLLHYLATGDRNGPEYEMVMPKLLCGYTLGMPLPGNILLPAEACAEADLLLQNVLQRWDKLKNTSIEGLREGFLRRNGRLYTRNDRLCLHVEAGAIDVLLDFLPWNLSLVKLPWLKDMLYVEWR